MEIEKQKEIDRSREKYSLIHCLLNILPDEIAEELKRFGRSYARKHEAGECVVCRYQRIYQYLRNASPLKNW